MLFDRVYFATATTGTGTITAGAAEVGYRNLATALDGSPIPNKTFVDYAITEGANWETGIGMVDAGGTTMTRVKSRSSTGSPLALAGAAKVMITPIAAEMNTERTDAMALARGFYMN